ncbi:MAG: flagellar biosynthetic protein FliO [Austwickia sp.]|nr:flagellar biosynthetic protein FliO [Austwickia sp.]
MTDGSSVVLMLRMALSLVIVLAAIFALARFVQRRQLGGGRLRQNGAVQVRVVARTTLSRNASVQVVEIGSHTLVLGVTDSTVNVLGDVPIADLIVDPEARPSPAPTNSDAERFRRRALPGV